MFIMGLTGGIGSGKSTVAGLFEAHGIATIDADDVSREVVEPGEPALERIAEHFGSGILNGAGELDRAALRQKVFANDAARQWLEQLLHPLILERIQYHLAQADSPYQLLVSPLLLETTQHRLCERILVVDVPESVQIERTMARDDNDREQVERIMAAQMPRDQRLAGADFVIDNNAEPDTVRQAVDRLHQQFLELAG